MNALFICGKARKRSPTAAELAADYPDVQTDYAGLSADADERVSREQIGWADVIVVMERSQITRLNRQFPRALAGKRIACLNVPDRYEFMEPALVDRLRPALRRVLRVP